MQKSGGALTSNSLVEADNIPDAKDEFVRLTASVEADQAGSAIDPLRHRGRDALSLRRQALESMPRGLRRAGIGPLPHDDRGRRPVALLRVTCPLRVLAVQEPPPHREGVPALRGGVMGSDRASCREGPDPRAEEDSASL